MVDGGEGKRQGKEVNLEAWTGGARAWRTWMMSLGFGRSRKGRF